MLAIHVHALLHTATCTKQWKKWTNQNWSRINLETLISLVATLIVLWATPRNQTEAIFFCSGCILYKFSGHFVPNYSLACTLLLHVLLQGTSLKHKISTQWAHRSVHVPPHMQDTPSNTSKYTMNFWQVIAWSKSVNYNLFYDKQLNMCTTPGRTNKGLIKTNTNSCTGCSTRSMTCMTKGWLKDAWLSKCMCAPRLAPTTSCILLVIIHLFTPTQPLVMTCMVAQKQDYCTIWSTAKKSSVSARGCSLKQNKETF